MSPIDEYLNTIDTPEKAALERIRQLVHQLVPNVEEVISYGMPGFKYKGKYFGGFNAFKDHLSLFPTSGPVEALKDKLGEFMTSKGTLQFTVDHPIPESLLKEIILKRKTAIDTGNKDYKK